MESYVSGLVIEGGGSKEFLGACIANGENGNSVMLSGRGNSFGWVSPPAEVDVWMLKAEAEAIDDAARRAIETSVEVVGQFIF